MKTIHYASAVFQVGDAVADALLAYARDLAAWGRTDSVVFPVVTLEGTQTTVSLLLTPASNLFTTTTTSTAASMPEEAAVLADLERRQAWLHATPVVTAGDAAPDDLMWLEFPDEPEEERLETTQTRRSPATSTPHSAPMRSIPVQDHVEQEDAPVIFTTVYVSTLRDTLNDDDVRELLDTSRAHNQEHGISGILVFRGRKVMQLLEGNEHDVRTLYARILADPRHDSIVTVWTSLHEQRRFPDWSMGFDELDSSAPSSSADARIWSEPSLTALEASTSSEALNEETAQYLKRRGAALRRALVSGDRLVASLAVILHGHSPETILDSNSVRLRCAECQAGAASPSISYPCSTAQNATWALEAS